MLRVEWPTYATDSYAHVWRLLDMSGMTKSVRESRNFTKSGYLYLDGNRITSLKHIVPLGKQIVLSLQFPNGKVVSQEMMVVPRVPGNRRSSMPTQRFYKP